MMAERAAEVKQKDVIIIPSPRSPRGSLEEGCVSGPKRTACAKFEQARPPEHATPQGLPGALPCLRSREREQVYSGSATARRPCCRAGTGVCLKPPSAARARPARTPSARDSPTPSADACGYRRLLGTRTAAVRPLPGSRTEPAATARIPPSPKKLSAMALS